MTRASAPTPSLPRRDFFGRALAALAGIAMFGRPRRAEAAPTIAPEFLGEIRMFAGGFAPTGWAFCNGQVLPIAPNTALFSLLGTNYGGNGTTTFALPDLRGRVAIHQGEGTGLTPRAVGQRAGVETHPLTLAELAVHNHSARAIAAAGTQATPSPMTKPARNPAQVPQWAAGPNANMALATTSVGSNEAHPNMQPALAVNFIIALTGQYPSQP